MYPRPLSYHEPAPLSRKTGTERFTTWYDTLSNSVRPVDLAEFLTPELSEAGAQLQLDIEPATDEDPQAIVETYSEAVGNVRITRISVDETGELRVEQRSELQEQPGEAEERAVSRGQFEVMQEPERTQLINRIGSIIHFAIELPQ